MILLKALLILGVLTAVVASGWGIYILLSAYDRVRAVPRADMFICQKGHGPLSENSLVEFYGQKVCPICFHESLKKAERGDI